MSEKSTASPKNFYLILFLLLSFFLSLGMDAPGHVHLRLLLSGVCVGGLFFLPGNLKSLLTIRSPSLFLFSFLLLFEIVRALLPPGIGTRFSLPEGSPELYMKAPLLWGLYLLGFTGAYISFDRKSASSCLLKFNALICFLLSLNCLVPLARTGNPLYSAEGKETFFYPIIYTSDWIGQYLMALFVHPNRLGDILAIGFFSALGVLLYFLLQWRSRSRAESFEKRISRREWESFSLFSLFALVIGVVILLIFSRGTIASVGLVFLISFSAFAVKFPSIKQWISLGVILILFVAFFAWAGNLKSAWKEVRSLEIENQIRKNDLNKEAYRSRSVFMNQEGARRALKIYEDYPIWGVGTNGYRLLAKDYSSEGAYKDLKNPDYAAWSHYLQLLAEEGMGAFIYYVFLVVYVVELVVGMTRTQSYFKFVSALSIAAPVFVIFIHASIIETMQRFTFAMPVYILMGASLSALRKNFEHEG